MANITLDPGPSVHRPASSSGIAEGAALPTLAIVVASVLFGLVPLFVRELQAVGLEPAAIAFWRFAFTAVLVLPFLPRRRGKAGQALLLTGSGILLGFSWVGYLHAMERAPIAITGVIYMSYPVFTVLFAWLLLRLRPGRRAWAACALVLVAAALIVSGGPALAQMPKDGLAALLWVVPTPVFFGLLIVVISTMAWRLTPVERLACGMWGSVLGLAPLVLLAEPGGFVPSGSDAWVLIGGLGALTALLPQLVYTIACARIGPTRSAAAGSIELPTMIAIGWLVFAEPVGATEIAASGLVLIAILLAPAMVPPRLADRG